MAIRKVIGNAMWNISIIIDNYIYENDIENSIVGTKSKIIENNWGVESEAE